jgi:hypothetical protein
MIGATSQRPDATITACLPLVAVPRHPRLRQTRHCACAGDKPLQFECPRSWLRVPPSCLAEARPGRTIANAAGWEMGGGRRGRAVGATRAWAAVSDRGRRFPTTYRLPVAHAPNGPADRQGRTPSVRRQSLPTRASAHRDGASQQGARLPCRHRSNHPTPRRARASRAARQEADRAAKAMGTAAAQQRAYPAASSTSAALLPRRAPHCLAPSGGWG